MHHEDTAEDNGEARVFRFDSDENAPPTRVTLVENILESMMEKMGLSCLDDQDLCLYRDRLFSEYV